MEDKYEQKINTLERKLLKQVKESDDVIQKHSEKGMKLEKLQKITEKHKLVLEIRKNILSLGKEK